MPFVDEATVNERIEITQRNLKVKETNVVVSPLRDTGSARVAGYTEEQKVLIGTFGRLDGKVTAARIFGTSRRTVEAYREGRPGQKSTEPSPELKDKVDNLTKNFRNRLAGLASQRLEKTLEALTDEKLDKVTKAVDLANISSTLAKTVSSLIPENNDDRESSVHYHFYRPRQRNEDEFEVIDAEAV